MRGELAALRGRAQGRLRQGDLRGSIDLYREVCEADGSDASAWFELGGAYGMAHQLDEARGCFERAIAIRPDFAEAHTQLGLVYFFQGQVRRAIDCYEHVLHLQPHAVDALCNLAFALDRVGEVEQAIAEYRKAHRLRPSVPILHSIGFAHLRIGEVDEGLAAFREAAALGGGDAESLGNLAFALNYIPEAGAEELFEAHRRWGAAVRRQLGPPPAHGDRRAPARPLRVGYVSGDFRAHSVAYFLLPLLAHHDRERVAVYGYSNVAQPDRLTERIRGLCDRWVEITRLTDAQAAARIRQDKVDILVDLSGLTRGNRLRLFALRPAPVQVTYLGYPNTTGIDTMDFRLTDGWADPPGLADGYHTEELVRLPRAFLCFEPPRDAPAVGPLPADTAGHVTFGSFNNMAKTVAPVVACWAELLRQLPGSRLLLKNEGLCDAAARARLRERFAALGVEPERVELLPTVPGRATHLELYQRVDIGLDTYPYNGTTTTCEAMWMGVPVVTLAGDRHAGRVGVSLLNQVGFGELIGEEEEGYRRAAMELAADRSRLRAVRAGLRGRIEGSTMCDGAAFARAVEDAYEAMWQKRRPGERA